VQDSLIARYLDKAEQLPYMYNDPAWELYCDSLITVCPNIAEAYQRKAIPYIKNGDYARAFELEKKAVELDPKAWLAYNAFLKCIFTKDYEGALIDFEKAQELSPDGFEMDHTYRFFQGLCNLELGRYSQAEENFKQDIIIQTRSNGREEDAHFNTLLYLGIVYYEMGENDKAEKYLLKCLASYKELPEANYYLALIYQRENKKALKGQYLGIAKQAKTQGYGMNEDNMFYVYYPHQITLYEINEALEK
jgi:tetratricopeptide (TPR) repeat protein